MDYYLKIAGAVVILIIIGVIAWFYSSYIDLKDINTKLFKNIAVNELTIEELNNTIKTKENVYKITQESIYALNKENEELRKKAASDIENIKSLERPENEKDCRIHPAIERSLSFVRKQRDH